MFDITLTDNFLYQSHFIETENITRCDQRKNTQITTKIKPVYSQTCLM